MSEDPIPYPTLGAAYPTAPKPIPKVELAAPIPAAVAQPQEEQKFFPLVPTSNSKYVAATTTDVWSPEEVTEEETAPATPTLENYEFDISPSLTPEPQTNSIVIEQIPDALLTGEIVTDSGEILKTGSIELPSITGEISIITESRAADKADSVDSANLGHSTVAPVRAPAVVNSQARIGALPSKHRRTSGQLMAMLTLAVLIVTVGSLYVMASVLGVIK